MSYTPNTPVAPEPRQTGPRWLPPVAGLTALVLGGIFTAAAISGPPAPAPVAAPPPAVSTPSASPTTATPTAAVDTRTEADRADDDGDGFGEDGYPVAYTSAQVDAWDKGRVDGEAGTTPAVVTEQAAYDAGYKAGQNDPDATRTSETRSNDELQQQGFEAGRDDEPRENQTYWTAEQKAAYDKGYGEGVDAAKEIAAEAKADEKFEEWLPDAMDDAQEVKIILEGIGQAAQEQNVFVLKIEGELLKDKAADMKKNQPPKSGKYKELHKQHNLMAKYYGLAGKNLSAGIENNSVSQIEKSTAYMNKANKATKKATAEIKDLQ